MTVGNKAITKSDVVNEIKILLILNNESYSDEKREQLQDMAIKSIIKRSIKKSEVERVNFLKFNQDDLNTELKKLANKINLDLDTLKNICASNELDFLLVEDQIKIELMWNSLIFEIYKNRLSINQEEIEEQIKLFQNKKNIEEYLISEILLPPIEKGKIKNEIQNLKKEIAECTFAVTFQGPNKVTEGCHLSKLQKHSYVFQDSNQNVCILLEYLVYKASRLDLPLMRLMAKQLQQDPA